MFELTETKIKKWSAEIGIADLGLSELDMRLMNALNVIYSDKFLSTRLYLNSDLVEKNLIERRGKGRSSHYVLRTKRTISGRLANDSRG